MTIMVLIVIRIAVFRVKNMKKLNKDKILIVNGNQNL